jgi:lipopolysaccharide transport system ATP-binding protein
MSDNKKRIMIELDNVSHSYHSGKKSFDHGTHHVLNQVSLRLYKGETLGIIGRNGVGKTTLLQLMAGILAPTLGEVRIHPGTSASLLTLGLGFKAELSGRDNALLAAMLQGSTRKRAESFLGDIAEFSELGDSFYEPVKNYSSGMRARLAFTTALMTHVDVLLIDEILSVGDAQFRGKAQAAMLSRVTGEQTVVFVSHMADQVKQMCNRVIWLEKGKIAAQGDAAEVVDAYTQHITLAREAGAKQQALLPESLRLP